MGKLMTTPSRVRSRETMEQEHHSRLALPSAQDHASCRGLTSSPAGRSADRFIPCRSSDQSVFDDLRSPGQNSNPATSAFTTLLASQLGLKTPPKGVQCPVTFTSPSPLPRKEKGRVLHFSATPPRAVSPYHPSLLSEDSASEARLLRATVNRYVPSTPCKALDAPGLANDFYSSLLDWSQQGLLGVALGPHLYIYNTVTSKPFKLTAYTAEATYARSVAWSQSGAHLAVGRNDGKVDLWDINKMQRVRTLRGHSKFVSAMCWNSHLLSTAGANADILNCDMRVPEDSVASLQGHRATVCGLKWSHSGRELASGGNDNRVLLWHAGLSRPQQVLTAHSACVKALAWSPHQAGLLATGGGSADRRIALWNTVKGSMIHSVHTGSQVCGLAWSQSINELLSTHGYAQNALHLWKAPSLVKTATLTGHSGRVLFLAMSPDGQTAATGAGDETVRFWQVFPRDTASSTSRLANSQERCIIR